MRFYELASQVEKDCFDLLHQTMMDPDVKLHTRLRACENILNRSAPIIKAVEHRGVAPVTILYVSPQDRARVALGEAPPTHQNALPGPSYDADDVQDGEWELVDDEGV